MGHMHQHILQSPAWEQFRKKTGVQVLSFTDGFRMTVHQIPYSRYTVGYLPKSPLPTRAVLEKISEAGKKHRCIFVKFEPDVVAGETELWHEGFDVRPSPHPLFTKYTFHIDLSLSEQKLLSRMKAKTRYNIRIAEKYGVTIVDETDNPAAFEHYIHLSKQTWRRQHFRGHTEQYHRLMWETLQPEGIAHLLVAYYPTANSQQSTANNHIPLTAWILFLHDGTLYYPYGASSDEYKHVMASNLMMWEAVKWGKQHGAKMFDLWGSLGPHPDPTHEWYGFHRFKEGYGGSLVEYIGSFDLVLHPFLYFLYTIAHRVRKALLTLPMPGKSA